MKNLCYFVKAEVLLALFLFLILAGGFPLSSQDTADGSFTNYQNTPVSSILDIYEQLSGKHLIRDVNLNTLPPVSINATGVSKADMMKLIEATLLLNSVAIVPIDDTTAKVVSIANSRNPRSEGVRIYANASDLPTSDEIVSYYMPLSYIGVDEAAKIFTDQAPPHTYGAYVPAPTAQAIVITEDVSTIRQLIALRELIDVPSARVTSEFIPIYHSDADKIAETLNKLLQQTKETATPGTSTVPPAVGTTEPLQNEHNLLSGPAQIMADSRSNRLLVITRPVNMPFLRQLVSELDKASDQIMPQRRALKYVSASDILPALEAAIAQGKEEQDQAAKDARDAQTSKPTDNSQGGGTASSSAGSSGGQGISTSSVTSSLKPPNDSDAPKVVSLGKTQLLADTRSNSILVLGTPDVTSRVFAMIDQLDHRPLQVHLATVIGQLTVKQDSEFGIDILQKFQKVGSNGFATSQITRSDTTASSAVPEPSTLRTSTGFPLPTGLTLYGAIGSTLDLYVKALENTNRFKIIDRPSIYTANNKLAVIATGSQVPIPGTTLSGITGSNNSVSTSSTTEYINVLLQLEIIPLINPNHQVTLKIRQTNNSLGANNTISGNQVPTINTQEINTEITVPDKATVVIGGLIADTNKRSTSGVPLLSDIPLLGYLFKDTLKSKERDELIIMIQPSVEETEDDQIAINEVEKQRTILGQDAMNQASGINTTDGNHHSYPRALPLNSSAKPVVTPAPDVSDGRLPADAPANSGH